jgi:glycosyltransferase involved in cell wall biosynthesis
VLPKNSSNLCAAESILLFVPMYNCAKQIPRVLSQLTEDVRTIFREVIIVDNRSPDGSARAAELALAGDWSIPVKILLNDENYGLGGSHKVAFNYAIANGFDYCVVLHGDDQGSISDIVPLIRSGAHRGTDCLLGARFMRASKLHGYSALRTFGNEAFNLLYSLASNFRIYDLGAGLNMYSVRALHAQHYINHANDLTFNYYMILESISDRWRIQFFPIAWREDDQISNVKLVRQAVRVLKIALNYAIFGGKFLVEDHSGHPSKLYSAQVIYDKQPATVGS